MQLRDVNVLEVRAAQIPRNSPRGGWECCSCGGSYPVEDGYKVVYETLPGITALAYVCPACAAAARDRA